MSPQMGYFLFGIAVFVVAVSGIFGYYLHRARETSRSSLDKLLTQLADVNREAIRQVAEDLIDEIGELRTDRQARLLRPEEIWRLVGGIEGLENLERNSQVLIQIASYVHEWHPDAEAAAEDLRIKAREIEWHLNSLRAAERAEKLEGWFANYAQHAVAVYYLMTRQVLALYETGPTALLSEVQRSL